MYTFFFTSLCIDTYNKLRTNFYFEILYFTHRMIYACRAETRFNNHLSRIRVRIENLFGIWKRRFPCLRYQLRLRLSTSVVVIVACAVLHNLARLRREDLPDDRDDQADGGVEECTGGECWEERGRTSNEEFLDSTF